MVDYVALQQKRGRKPALRTTRKRAGTEPKDGAHPFPRAAGLPSRHDPLLERNITMGLLVDG
ncbi:hypothetical protein ACC848_42755, partial [Rhizobium johnstonii]